MNWQSIKDILKKYIPYYRNREITFTRSQIELLSLKNKYKGNRCFIIGNGPSLRIEDLHCLKDEITFASNKIFLSYEKTQWRPTFYCSEDLLVLKQNKEEMLQLENSLFFFPYLAYPYMKNKKDTLFYNRVVIGNTENPLARNDFPGFSFDIIEGVNWGSTIVYTQLQFAVYMGFKDIYLLGVDFDFKLPNKKVKNYYISEGETNHFHKDYRKKGEKWYQPNLDVQLRSFKEAAAAISSSPINIYNATRGGKLEVFPRVLFDEIISQE